jgi:predicted RNA-binding Zn ribbon-like protein
MDKYKFDMNGGRLCLNFSNTVGAHAGDHPSEHLHSYADLVRWSQQAGIATGRQAQQLLHEAAQAPPKAAIILKRAIALREIIYRIFSAIAAGRSPRIADLEELNKMLSRVLVKLQIVQVKEGFRWDWMMKEETLDMMLWPVVRSAAELLTSEELHRVRECANETCGWVFLDTSKNHSRRWCDMKSCGNAAKARRYYARHKEDDRPK